MTCATQAQAPFSITLLAGAESKFWDSCAQNKTSEISNIALSGILGLLCAEQNIWNIGNAHSGIMGLLCAEQNVENLENALSGILGLLCEVYSLQDSFRRRDRARA